MEPCIDLTTLTLMYVLLAAVVGLIVGSICWYLGKRAGRRSVVEDVGFVRRMPKLKNVVNIR